MSDQASADTVKPQVTIVQLAGNEMFRGRRADGTGWDWSWAERQRPWMDASTNKFAYRCLPLSIANQAGWWVHNPVGFTAVWSGHAGPGSVKFLFDADPNFWRGSINDQFGQGIVSWNIPLLFRTRPAGSRILVSGPLNSFKHALQPLTAIIESDWMYMSFTMNWKFTSSRAAVRFDAGEPVMQVIPIFSNVVAELERSNVTYMQLEQDPQMLETFRTWCRGRDEFRDQMKAGQIRDGWQKDYFLAQSPLEPQIEGHKIRFDPPPIDYRSPRP